MRERETERESERERESGTGSFTQRGSRTRQKEKKNSYQVIHKECYFVKRKGRKGHHVARKRS